MKPLFRKITDALGYSFSFVHESPPLFDTPWHFHPEYELIYIKNSGGKRFMGDHIGDFDDMELILIGPNIPHFWQNDPRLSLDQAKAFVVHFRSDFLGEQYFGLPETYGIKKLFEKARLGLRIGGKSKPEICSLIEHLAFHTGFERLLMLQKILLLVSEAAELEPLASAGFVDNFKPSQDDRMNRIYEYVMYNFREKMTLTDISAVACLSEVAFCKYFKSHTGKSFFNFLNDIKIGYACRLLLESNMNIAEVCYESGFNNLSHFNQQFRRHLKSSPQRYRELFKK